MVCGNCVDKLARRLFQHHKIDMIRAYELAEKAVERVENRAVPSPEIKSGNPTDYTQTCTIGTCIKSTTNCAKAGAYCELDADCSGGVCLAEGTCGCPAPLANSHQISGCSVGCVVSGTCAKCNKVKAVCAPTCATSCASGTCGYDCDPPRIWNPVTLTCDLIPVPAKPLINMPLVNPILVNPPIVRALETKSLQ